MLLVAAAKPPALKRRRWIANLLLLFATLWAINNLSQRDRQLITQAHCGASRKFLTGFLIAILLGKSVVRLSAGIAGRFA